MWAALLGFGALVALFISWPIKRARFWVALIMVGYFVPRYWDLAGIGQIYMFNLLVDSFICLIIERYAKTAWEVRIYNVYRISALTSLLFLTGQVMLTYFSTPSTFMGYYFEGYGTILEIWNWTALAIITREGWPELYGRLASYSHGRPHRQVSRQALRTPRTSHSWQRK